MLLVIDVSLSVTVAELNIIYVQNVETAQKG